jgi:beta-phosphoglucomutase
MTPHAVVFDFDGVLADSEPLHLRVYQELLAEDGLTLTPAEYFDSYLGFDDIGVFEALARDKGLAIGNGRLEALVARKTEIFQALARREQVFFPGAADCVRAFAAVCPIAIASGALRHEIELILEAAGLTTVVPVIVAAGETPRSKPAPDPYARAIELLGVHHGCTIQPRQSIAIEDSRWGLDSARAAGLTTVAVTTSYDASQLGGADLIVPGIAQVTVELVSRLVASTNAGRAKE